MSTATGVNSNYCESAKDCPGQIELNLSAFSFHTSFSIMQSKPTGDLNFLLEHILCAVAEHIAEVVVVVVVIGVVVVGGPLHTGNDDLLLGAGLTADLAAPLELAVARGLHLHHLLLNVEAAAVAQLGALSDLLGGVGAVGVGHAGPAFYALEAGARVHAAVVGRGLEEHQLAPLDVLLLVLGREVAGLQVATFNSVG